MAPTNPSYTLLYLDILRRAPNDLANAQHGGPHYSTTPRAIQDLSQRVALILSLKSILRTSQPQGLAPSG
jgi:hypothetical protein